MFVLFDQGTPVAIRHALQSHTVKTASEQGWRWSLVKLVIPQIVAAIDAAKPGTYTLIDIPVR